MLTLLALGLRVGACRGAVLGRERLCARVLQFQRRLHGGPHVRHALDPRRVGHPGARRNSCGGRQGGRRGRGPHAGADAGQPTRLGERGGRGGRVGAAARERCWPRRRWRCGGGVSVADGCTVERFARPQAAGCTLSRTRKDAESFFAWRVRCITLACQLIASGSRPALASFQKDRRGHERFQCVHVHRGAKRRHVAQRLPKQRRSLFGCAPMARGPRQGQPQSAGR